MRSATIETTRLQPRPLTLDDVDHLHQIWIEPEVRRYLWDDEVISRERVRAIIEESLVLFKANGYGLCAVRPRESHELIGFCGFWFFHEPPSVELLYGIAPRYCGAGLATETAKAMLGYGFGELGVKRIEASTDAENHASSRVMEKAGMTFWKRENTNSLDTIYYAICRDSYELESFS